MRPEWTASIGLLLPYLHSGRASSNTVRKPRQIVSLGSSVGSLVVACAFVWSLTANLARRFA